MTGTLIVSSSPIAVFSCNDCNPVTGQGGCDHMLEQLPPTSSIDTAYVVTPHMNSDIKIRILATEFSINFYNCTNKSMSKIYNRLEFVDIVISNNESCYIESGKPIMVASFELSSSLENKANCLCQSYLESTITGITTRSWFLLHMNTIIYR